MSKHSVFCIVTAVSQAEGIVAQLKDEGFSNHDISLLFPNKEDAQAPEGSATGVGCGAIQRGVLGWLAGMDDLDIPDVGPVIGAGPIAAALNAAALVGAPDGIAGALIGLGIPEFEARRYEGRIKNGGILISIHTEDFDELCRVKEIFKAVDASDISTADEARAPRPERQTSFARESSAYDF
jgi:hypothetical protein